MLLKERKDKKGAASATMQSSPENTGKIKEIWEPMEEIHLCSLPPHSQLQYQHAETRVSLGTAEKHVLLKHTKPFLLCHFPRKRQIPALYSWRGGWGGRKKTPKPFHSNPERAVPQLSSERVQCFFSCRILACSRLGY